MKSVIYMFVESIPEVTLVPKREIFVKRKIMYLLFSLYNFNSDMLKEKNRELI